MLDAYDDFLVMKSQEQPDTGLDDIPDLPDCLFDFQRDIVRWALRRGRAAIFAGTGLGKSLMEMSWADAVYRATGRDVLILAPLAVSSQFLREAAKFGIEARQCRDASEVGPGINITNYEKLAKFDMSAFGGIVLDESSILKAQDGKTRTAIIQSCKDIPFRLAATATPSPNDFMELGNHAEFLDIMSYTDMLATFFVHDGGDTSQWRLKGHAEGPFWRWMCSWAVMIRKPSDLGYDDGAYNLPPLNQTEHIVGVEYKASMETGLLFPLEARSMSERIGARRDTVEMRVAKAVELTPADRPFVWWCNLNSESEALTAAIPGAVETKGSDSDEVKEQKLTDFSEGRIRVLVTKPRVAGFGMNWQHCADTGFVGLNDSFEQVYQSIRRFWRFGQTKPVNVHFIAAETEGAVLANIRRKESDAERMAMAMVAHMAALNTDNIRGASRDRADYNPETPIIIPSWIGDSR